MGRIFHLENEGRFEGYVGKEPVVKINARDQPQCFLHVGQTPKVKREDGKWHQMKTVWAHFACFGPVARVVENSVRVGDRVEVKYALNMRFDPRFKGQTTCLHATIVRPLKDGYDTPSPTRDLGSFEDRWRPRKPLEGSKWEVEDDTDATEDESDDEEEEADEEAVA